MVGYHVNLYCVLNNILMLNSVNSGVKSNEVVWGFVSQQKVLGSIPNV